MADNPLSPLTVNYGRTTEVKIEQPADVTRAKASAWLDLISPLTEWAGLHGDKLKHKRDLIRIEQDAALNELAVRLASKLRGKTITPLPPKVLIPALEKASLESRDSELIERWAQLLASAATDPGDDLVTCISILGDLSAQHVKILYDLSQKLKTSDSGVDVDIWNGALTRDIHFNNQACELRNLANGIDIMEPDAWREFGALIEAQFETFRLPLELAEHRRDGQGEYLRDGTPVPVTPAISVMSYVPLWSTQNGIAMDVLAYRNLVRRRVWKFGETDAGKLELSYWDFTSLGRRFLERVMPETSAQKG